MFIDISALVKIVEEKFLAVQILIEKFWGWRDKSDRSSPE
jgi:hypothetical protein